MDESKSQACYEVDKSFFFLNIHVNFPTERYSREIMQTCKISIS